MRYYSSRLAGRENAIQYPMVGYGQNMHRITMYNCTRVVHAKVRMAGGFLQQMFMVLSTSLVLCTFVFLWLAFGNCSVQKRNTVPSSHSLPRHQMNEVKCKIYFSELSGGSHVDADLLRP